MKKCKNCNSEDMVWIEWMWAYDGILAWQCDECDSVYHANTWYKILAYTQPEEYGAVYFILKNKNDILLYKNRYLYSPNIKEDKIFDNLMEYITI